MTVWNILDTINWVLWPILAFHFFRNRKEWATATKLETLRKEALDIILNNDSSFTLKGIDLPLVGEAKDVEALRLFIRFEGQIAFYNLAAMVSTVKLRRMEYRTNLRARNITREQADVFFAINDMKSDILERFEEEGSNKALKREHKKVELTALYAMANMGEADEIVSIVKDRGVYQLKHVKSLMGQMQESSVTPLNDGVL